MLDPTSPSDRIIVALRNNVVTNLQHTFYHHTSDAPHQLPDEFTEFVYDKLEQAYVQAWLYLYGKNDPVFAEWYTPSYLPDSELSLRMEELSSRTVDLLTEADEMDDIVPPEFAVQINTLIQTLLFLKQPEHILVWENISERVLEVLSCADGEDGLIRQAVLPILRDDIEKTMIPSFTDAYMKDLTDPLYEIANKVMDGFFSGVSQIPRITLDGSNKEEEWHREAVSASLYYFAKGIFIPHLVEGMLKARAIIQHDVMFGHNRAGIPSTPEIWETDSEQLLYMAQVFSEPFSNMFMDLSNGKDSPAAELHPMIGVILSALTSSQFDVFRKGMSKTHS